MSTEEYQVLQRLTARSDVVAKSTPTAVPVPLPVVVEVKPIKDETNTTNAKDIREKSSSDGVTKIDCADVTQRDGSYGDRPIVMLTASIHQAKEEAEKFAEYAMVLRRRVDKNRETVSTKIEIRSEIIRHGIQQVFGDYPFINLKASPIIFRKPYYELFHYWKELYEYAVSGQRTEEEKKHMAVLTGFMKLHLKEMEKTYDQLVPNGLITYDSIRTIFRPDQIVVRKQDDLQECFWVFDADERGKDGNVYLQIKCFSWRYNGTRFGPYLNRLKIESFPGVMKINQLDVYPIDHLPPEESGKLRKTLIERGHQWRSLVDTSHREHNGIASIIDKNGPIIPTHISGRVVIDHKTHYQINSTMTIGLYPTNLVIDVEKQIAAEDVPPGNDKSALSSEGESSNDTVAESYKKDLKPDSKDLKALAQENAPSSVNDPGSLPPGDDGIQTRDGLFYSYINRPKYKLTEQQALLCPGTIPGFSLVEKVWGFFRVDKLQPICWAESAFDKLEMNAGPKNVMRSLVQMHQSSGTSFDDIIAGKGKGLVFLLYGPPGCGKTLTAETIAEHTRKPLYWVTSGELGTEVSTTDARLRVIFSLARAWDAILLLDEADVFLAKRTRAEMVRNAFVSIFLRSIEYYQGILFLTTNRRDEFDEAFQSRIHLTLHYRPLTEGRKACIWRNLLEGRAAVPAEWDMAVYARFGRKYDLNGREIKNLISTALAISAQDERMLSEDVIDMLYELNKAATLLESEPTDKGTGGVA